MPAASFTLTEAEFSELRMVEFRSRAGSADFAWALPRVRFVAMECERVIEEGKLGFVLRGTCLGAPAETTRITREGRFEIITLD